MTEPLVERESELQALDACLRAVDEKGGRIALVAGEAGIGKTSLLRAFAHAHPRTALWWGACDALQTPHPLAPLHDIARDADVRFGALLHVAPSRAALFDAVLDELRRAVDPVLVVIEDAHWADDATFDLLKFIGRRIERTKALLAVSFRDDEVNASHPLRRVIGELPSVALARIDLARLSQGGVAALARRALRSPAGLFAATHGNPFFVSELLRHPLEQLPRTVQDLVLARFARLVPSAQAIVRLASIVPAQIERWLVDTLLAPEMADVEACLDSGLLLADASTLRFRHELARAAVESAIASPVAQALHAQVLRALAAEGRAVPPARLAHHAVRAHDASAMRRHVPAAAGDARARGAHREAARHYRTTLQQVTSASEDKRRRWLEAYAEECQFLDRHDEALAARLELDVSFERSGDVVAQARNLSRLALLHVFMMRNAQADAASLRAIEMLERLAPSPALAAAYGIEAGLRMLNRDCAESVEWGRKAIELAGRFGDHHRLCASRCSVGTALMFIDYDSGCRQMEEALQMALAENFPVLAANAMQNLGSASGELMRLAVAQEWLRRAVDYAGERELDDIRNYATAWLAMCELHTGRWADAAERASDVAARSGTSAISRVMALVALGRLRARRGDPQADAALDEALALAGSAETLQRIAPVRAARAESAFARGDLTSAGAEARAALPLALRHGHPWFIGELAFWCWRAGALDEAPDGCAEPYALHISGHWRDAAVAWAALGCPYEQARALADGDEAAQREALAIFEQLGAQPATAALRARLHGAGVRGLARGPRASTREQAFGLTTRELQVLHLLCDGLRNADIAQRLHRSVRTVDHHLAAVFAKLGVDSRVAAIQAAQRAGLAPQSGQSRTAK